MTHVDSEPAMSTALRLAEEMLPLLRQHAGAIDAAASFPEAGLQAMRRNGLLGLLVPVEAGGLGGSLRTLVDVAQILASGCLSTAMIWAMHCQQVDVLVRHGSADLRSRLLPRIARGEVYLASVTTEPGTGGHLLSAESPLRPADGELQIFREAPIVTGGDRADGFLVTMRADADSTGNRVTLVYADRRQLTLDRRDGWDPLGMRGTHSVGLTLRGSVAPAQVVGEPGRFRDVATESMIPAGHLAWSACWLGCARSALGDVIALARSPRRPRGLDPTSELVRERLARVRMGLELVGGYLDRVCAEVIEHRETGRSLDTPATQIHLNTLKVAAATHTFRAVDGLMQLCGLGTGYMRTSPLPLERQFRDLRSASLNLSDDRLLVTTGALTLLDRSVRLV